MTALGAPPWYALASIALVAVALGFVTWRVEPAWLLSLGFVLSTFNSNWDLWGLPSSIAPDRLLMLTGIGAVLLRSPPVRDRACFRLRPIHVLFLATIAWSVASALEAGTLLRGEILFLISDRMIVPFAVFLVAPFAFRTRRQRGILVATMVGFGAYVGLTTLFETLGPRALVIPPGILDASIGYHAGRGRGPFLEGSVNGVAMYTVIAFVGIAVATWRNVWSRLFAIGVASVCALGLLFTLTRSVWVGAIVATAATMLLTRELRRYLLPGVAVACVSLSLLFSALPGLALRAEERRSVQSSVWERENVNAAALQMAWVRPLVGVGLGTFNQRNADYFPLLDDIPQVAERHLAIHNVFLRLLTESGLIGVTLFLASVLAPVGAALFGRGPPEARLWQTALLAVFLFWIVVANLAPIGQVFPSTVVWLLAGVTLAACADVPGTARRPPA